MQQIFADKKNINRFLKETEIMVLFLDVEKHDCYSTKYRNTMKGLTIDETSNQFQ